MNKLGEAVARQIFGDPLRGVMLGDAEWVSWLDSNEQETGFRPTEIEFSRKVWLRIIPTIEPSLIFIHEGFPGIVLRLTTGDLAIRPARKR